MAIQWVALEITLSIVVKFDEHLKMDRFTTLFQFTSSKSTSYTTEPEGTTAVNRFEPVGSE